MSREGAVCQWHTLSADRHGVPTAVCQWHTISADRNGVQTAVCQWHTLSADRNGVQTTLHSQRDPEICGRQAAKIAACVHAFVTGKPKG